MSRKELLYDLLPRYIRFRDQGDGQALEALMGVLDLEYQRLHHGVERLYEDWFIETCQPFLVPFIGDLVGLDLLHRGGHSRFTWRPLVAKAVARRRYKGTVSSLERAVHDATGWSCHAREQSESLAWSQDLRAVKPGFGGFIDLRDRSVLLSQGTPFDVAAHTVDVRRDPGLSPVSGSCLFNLPRVTVNIWRVEARPIWRGAPRRVADGCYTFDPFGQDVPLHIQPEGLPPEGRAVSDLDLPIPLRRETLGKLLDDLRRGEVLGQEGQSPVRSWLEIFDVAAGRPVQLRSIAAWDLGDWRRPLPGDVSRVDSGYGRTVEYPIEAAVDPQLGRLTLAKDFGASRAGSPASEPAPSPEPPVRVSYSYGMGCDVGGGPHRRQSVQPQVGAWRALITTDDGGAGSDDLGPAIYATLEAALAAWPPEEPRGHLRIVGSGRLDAPRGAWQLDLRDGRRELVIEASEGARPFLSGHLVAHGRRLDEPVAGLEKEQPELCLRGLWLDGSVGVTGSLVVGIEDSTLGPPLARPRGRSAKHTPTLRPGGALCAREPVMALIRVDASILGPVRLPMKGIALEIRDSIIDGGLWQSGDAAAFAGASATEHGTGVKLRRSTVLGEARMMTVDAVDTFFTRRLDVRRSSLGSLRHCFVPPGDGELPPSSDGLPPPSPNPCCEAPGWAGSRRSENWLTSVAYGEPGYGQIRTGAPLELWVGGTEGSAVGVQHRLFEADRLERLPPIFESSLRTGMEAQVVLIDGARTADFLNKPRTATGPEREDDEP